MFRNVVGEKEFRQIVKNYTNLYPYQDAQTEDFQKAVYATTGSTYSWFFDQWFRRGGEPEYNVNYEIINDKNNNQFVNINIKQVHATNNLVGWFKMPIVIDVYYKDGTVSSDKYWVENEFTEIRIANKDKKEVDFVLFDPNREVLKKVTFNKSFEELSSQVLKAKNMIDRYDGLIAMRNTDLSKKKDLLIKAYDQEKFYMTKGEIISQLSKDKSAETEILFTKAINDNDVYTRRALLKNVTKVGVGIKKEYEKLLKDSSYINVEYALTNLCASFPEDINKYLETTKNEIGWRGINIRIKWLEIALTNDKSEYLKELIDYSSMSYEFETRINAINVLVNINYLDKFVLDNLFEASLYWNNKLSPVAQNAIKHFYKQNNYRIIIDKYYNGNTWTKEQKAVLEKCFVK